MANYYNKDLYKVLNLTYEASQEEIKASYRKLARMYHPDVDPSEDALEKFKDIKEAYDVLIDEESRKKYDVLHGFFKQKIKKEFEKTRKNKYEEYVKRAKENSKKSEPFAKAMNEALDNLFHSNKENYDNKPKETKRPIKGEDINVNVNVNCFEALNGTNRKVNILHTQPCPNCGGRKFINGAQCNMCKGKGILSFQKKINVKIPKGVTQGSKVRVKGEGNKGLNGGKDGDLYLLVSLKNNQYFDIDGLNILCNMPVSPYEAVLGAEISLPIGEEKIKVKVPPMSSTGQKLKLAGLGLEDKNKSKKGDVIITIQIKLPKKLSEKEIELYKNLKEFSKDNIRKDFKYD